MLMKDPKPTFSYVVQQIRDKYPKFAYMHVVEPRAVVEYGMSVPEGQSNDFIREIWGDRPLISAGGHDRDIAIELTNKNPFELVAFSRYFIANVRFSSEDKFN